MTEQYNKEITAEYRLLDFHFREIINYRDLIFLFVKRDFTAKYKQTILGPLWAVVQPLLSTLVFVIVFGKMANLSTADIPGEYILPDFLFYMSGNICFIYFSTTFDATTRVFINNRSVMGKVYYPRLVSPISIAISQMIPFGIHMALFFGLWMYYILRGGTNIVVSVWIAMAPFLVFQLMLFSIGLGLIVSAFTTRYRDLLMLVGFGLEIVRYFCPVAYGLELVPLNLRGLYLLNPLTPIITTFRYAFFGFGYFDVSVYLISWASTLGILLIGIIFFNKTERNFMDII